MGLAGVLPYLATSLSTVYCAWELNHAAEAGTGLFLNEKLAEQALHILEPLQVGYGAVVSQDIHFTKPVQFTNANILDPVLPRRNPLGSGVGAIRWRKGLSTLRDWRDQYSRSLADDLHARRIRANHTIPGLHFPLLHRRPCKEPWLDTCMVRYLPLRAYFHSGKQHRGFVDWPWTGCRSHQQEGEYN